MNVSLFQKTIWNYYSKNRRDLPWRNTTNPYHILVSEIMLQQTQVARVLKKYSEFITTFPTIKSLARASVKDVLTVWQGMGYNRRALYLKQIAGLVVTKYKTKFPKDPAILETLPGIGVTTASSIIAFSYNIPTVFIETNIRRVFIHFFFKNEEKVSDKNILILIKKTLDTKNSREWYYALMDYGAMLSLNIVNPNRRSLHYVRQSKFEGSTRQVRGAILTSLLEKEKTNEELNNALPFPLSRIQVALQSLIREGFVSQKKGAYGLKEN